MLVFVSRRFRKIAKSDSLASSCLSFRVYNSAPTGWIFVKFGIRVFFKILHRKCKLILNTHKDYGTSHKQRYTSYFAHFLLEGEIFQ
jgi:hypothetical protein